MDYRVDEIAFYILSASIFTLTILAFYFGERKASIWFAAFMGVILVGFLLFGVVAKDMHNISLPMEEIATFFFGFLKALFPLVWVVALLHRGTEAASKKPKES